MVFLAGTGEEKWDKGIPSGFGWTDCERSVWVWVFQFCPLPLFIEGGEGAQAPSIFIEFGQFELIIQDLFLLNRWSC